MGFDKRVRSIAIGAMAVCAWALALSSGHAASTAATPLAKVIIDRNENLSLNCAPLNASDLPTYLKSSLDKIQPQDRTGEILAEGDGRYQPTQLVLQQFEALSIYQVRFGTGVAGVSILCNAVVLPGFSVIASIGPVGPPHAAQPPNTMRVSIDFNGQVSVDGSPNAGNGQFIRRLEAALAKNQAIRLEVRTNRLAKYGELMWILLEAKRHGVRSLTVLFEA